MESPTEMLSPFPVDARALLDMGGESLDYAKRAYKTWLDAAGEVQSEAIEFLNNRLAKDSAVVARFGRCKTPVEVLNLQAEYAGDALADFLDEGQKIVDRLGKAASVGIFSARGDEPDSKCAEAPSHKRSAHRATGR